jgi:hypothetical protein
MAKSKPSTGDIKEFVRGSDVPQAGSIIEYDPQASHRASRPTVQTVATADTIVLPPDFLAARDALQRRLQLQPGSVARFAAASPDAAGLENIVGVGVGYRFAGASLSAELAAKVYVREKLPLARLASAAVVPSSIAGVPTDVEAVGEVELHSFTAKRPRPVPCGVSISNINLAGSGTLGCLVVLQNNRLCLLSNNHVIANENAASIGDEIIQPGNAEPVPAPDQLIGVLENFVRINATGNLVDAAVAWTSFALVQPAHVTYRMNATPLGATFGMTVRKNGRTTQATLGVVTDMGVNIFVPYDPFPAGAEMRDQIGIRGVNGPFSRAGDSGSIIVSNGTKQPVALLFAGAADNSITFANPIQAVIDALDIREFVGGDE